jgi:Flp pilus assembly protein TadG
MRMFAFLSAKRANPPDPSLDESDSGGALLEFTVIMPLFFLIVFGIIEWGLIFFLQNNMVNASREAAREWAVQNQALTQQNVCDRAKTYLTGAQLNLNDPQVFTCTATDHCPAESAVTVQLTANAAAASVLNFTGYFTGGNLAATVKMRKETACP